MYLSTTRLQCRRSTEEAPERRCKDVWGQTAVRQTQCGGGAHTAHLPVPTPAAGSSTASSSTPALDK
jgi:hypothetical protein